jgi:hypothetical protein
MAKNQNIRNVKKPPKIKEIESQQLYEDLLSRNSNLKESLRKKELGIEALKKMIIDVFSISSSTFSNLYQACAKNETNVFGDLNTECTVDIKTAKLMHTSNMQNDLDTRSPFEDQPCFLNSQQNELDWVGLSSECYRCDNIVPVSDTKLSVDLHEIELDQMDIELLKGLSDDFFPDLETDFSL